MAREERLHIAFYDIKGKHLESTDIFTSAQPEEAAKRAKKSHTPGSYIAAYTVQVEVRNRHGKLLYNDYI